MGKFINKEKKSIITQTLQKKKSSLEETKDHFKVSFEHFDKTQKYGSSFKNWQKEQFLADTLKLFQGFSHQSLQSIFNGKKFALYGDFPGHSKFNHPSNVPQDAHWARIHLTGLVVLAGHVVGNTFYLVFFDKGHNFYPTN